MAESLPDLETVATREDLADLLRLLHIEAGKPSMRTIAKLAGEGEGEESKESLAPSTQSSMLNGHRLPGHRPMMTFVRACGVKDPQELERWKKAWARVTWAERDRPSLKQELQALRDEAVREGRAEAERLIEAARQEAAAFVQKRRIEVEAQAIAQIEALLDQARHVRDGKDPDRVQQAEELFWQALDLAIARGSRQQLGWAFDGLGSCRWRREDPDTELAERLFTRALALGQETGDLELQAWSLANFGTLHSRDAPETAKGFFQRALEVAGPEHWNAIGWISMDLGELLDAEDPGVACRLYQDALRAGENAEQPSLTGWSLIHLAEILMRADLRGRPDLFSRAEKIGRKLGDTNMIDRATRGLARSMSNQHLFGP